MNFPAHIFKAYDIRGLVKEDLSEELAYKIGRAFVSFLRSKKQDLTGKKIVVGRDMRESSDFFAPAVIKGITDEGVNVVDIGLTSTPLFNFACAHYEEHAGGIMVTASHNPAEYNGFKLTLGSGLPVGKSSGMDAIRELVERNDFGPIKNQGVVEIFDAFPDYSERIFTIVKPEELAPPKGKKNFKIVVDAGNGMADVTIPKILKHLRVDAEFLFLEPDGSFPNHEANPLKIETLKALQKAVVKNKADFGFALDGDADRIGLVDERGKVVDASFVGALIGLEVLRSYPGSEMLYDLRSSSIIKEVWERVGGKAEMCVVGHALIKKMMAEKQAVFASELSQHLYYQDMYNMESTDLSLLYILKLISREKKALSQIVKPLKKYSHSGEINFEVENKEAVISEIENTYAPKAKNTSRIDGLWLGFGWGWFNIRASNTEPVLRLNLEASTKKKMTAEVNKIKRLVKKTSKHA